MFWVIFGPPPQFVFKFDSPPKKKAISVCFAMGSTTCINEEIQCLPYAGLFTYIIGQDNIMSFFPWP